MPIRPEDYETPELPPLIQAHTLVALLEGKGPQQHVASVQCAVKKLFPDAALTDTYSDRHRKIYPILESLRPIFAQHDALWPILFKTKPRYPQNMFAEQKTLADDIVAQAGSETSEPEHGT